MILNKYKDDYELFKIFGLPENIEFKLFPGCNDYNVNKRTKITLNTELYKLYDCGYLTEDELIHFTIATINRYKRKTATIKELVKEARDIRIKYINEQLILY